MASPRRLRLALAGLIVFASLAAEAGAGPGDGTPAQSPTQALTLSISPARTPVTFTRKEENVVIGFTVDSSAAVATPGVRLLATPFVDDQGRPFEIKLLVNGLPSDPQKVFDVPAFGHVPVRIEANLPRPGGTYTAHLTLIQSGQTPTPVALTVQRPAAAVTVRDIPAMKATGGSVVIPLTLQETSGQTVEVKVPVVVGLTRDTGEQVKTGSTAHWDVLDSPAGKTSPKETISFQGIHTLGLRVDGLEGPGKYEGAVVVPFGSQTVEKGLTIYVRWHWFWALFLIAIGVVVSWLLRRYLTEERPRLVERRRGDLILEDLEGSLPPGDLEPREQTLVMSLRGQVGKLFQRLEAGADLTEIKAAFTLLGTKVSLVAPWILLGRQVRKLEPPELRIQPQGKLDDVERTLLDPGADTAALSTAKQVLQSLPGEIKTAVRGYLQKHLDDIDTQSRATAAAASSSVTALLPIQLTPPLDRAREALKNDRLEEAAQALDEAWKAYAAILAGEIGRMLAGARPAFLTDDEWKDLQDRANAALAPARQPDSNPERAVAAVRTAQSIYLEGIGTLLTRRIDSKLREIEKDEAQKALWEKLTRIRADLQQGLTWITEGKLDQAGRRITKANDDLLAAASPEGQLGDEVRLPQGAWVPTPAPDLLARLQFSSDGLSIPDFSAVPPPSASQRLRKYDLWANLTVMAIASVLGLPVLWVTHPAWGGFQDGLTAVLWGLGLHQFSYNGIKGLLERLST